MPSSFSIQILTVKANASSVILADKHLSGNLKPSQSDIQIAEIVKDALQLLEFHLLDHLILNKDGEYGIRDIMIR